MASSWTGTLEKIAECTWRIPETFMPGMRVPGIIYASDELIGQVRADQAPQQLVNVAHLPGLAGPVVAMPDIHWGYGFPIGGVAAMDQDNGVISPGGVGYDINCGVRLVRTNLEKKELLPRIRSLTEALFRDIPCGVGEKGRITLTRKQLFRVLREGSGWAVAEGYGRDDDLLHTEEGGCMEGADPALLTDRALLRGLPQLGTLGSGNHFLEIQAVSRVYDPDIAALWGLRENQIVVMIHSGSRGLGYQVCDDSLDTMVKAMDTYGISVPDRQLCCAPVRSLEGRAYFAAMAAAANYAWANRQIIMHWVRRSFERILGASPASLDMTLLYDVAHNIAKFERYTDAGRERELLVHRKGATRAFAPEHPALPARYRSTGQPVLIPGDMGTASYVLAGTEKAMTASWGSCCHGAGRVMSRKAAVRAGKNRDIAAELARKGVHVQSRGHRTLLEEAPEAYKNIHSVVDVVESAGLARKIIQMMPLGVVKG
ncbi:RtcB family protein [bacterium]|nr:RtcB family protein [bacterium]